MSTSMPTRAITRARDRLACTECRRRKLKCDRSQPCSSCIRRGVRDSCLYQRLPSTRNGPNTRAEERLDHLESVIQGLVSKSEGPKLDSQRSSPSGSDGNGSHGTRSQSLPGESAPPRGSTHWGSVLEDIQDLRLALSIDPYPDDAPPLASDSQGLGILFGSHVSPSLETILATYLPSRQEVDRLTSSYFRSQAITATYIHTQHFRRMYSAFWDNPINTPIMWTSTLFSICHIAHSILKPHGQKSSAKDDRFSVAAALCLTTGEYVRPKPFVVEAILIFIQSHCFTHAVLSPDIAPASATMIRMATAMGYHQASIDKALSPFEAEMRRRTWSICMQIDLLISFNLGLPSAMAFSTWPVEPPRNLLDSDFDENSIELPPSRPDSDPTRMLFVISKHKSMVVFDKIQQHALSARNRPLDMGQVDALDAELRRVRESTPQSLRPVPMAESVFDAPHLIVTRLCNTFIYCKCLIVLHRTYALHGQGKSLRICYEAATHLVREVVEVYDEFNPGGQVEAERWFMSSLSWHDFLLGSVALCLVALVDNRPGYRQKVVDRAETSKLLKRARAIASKAGSTRGRETQRIGDVMAATAQILTTTDDTHVKTPRLGEASLPDMDWGSGPSYSGDPLWEEFISQYLDVDGYIQASFDSNISTG